MLAVLLLPLGLQLVLFFIALFILSPRVLLFIPAVFSDVLYGANGFPVLVMTFSVAVALCVQWFLLRKTRVGNLFYGMETR